MEGPPDFSLGFLGKLSQGRFVNFAPVAALARRDGAEFGIVLERFLAYGAGRTTIADCRMPNAEWGKRIGLRPS
jgi:hypothetical protein